MVQISFPYFLRLILWNVWRGWMTIQYHITIVVLVSIISPSISIYIHTLSLFNIKIWHLQILAWDVCWKEFKKVWFHRSNVCYPSWWYGSKQYHALRIREVVEQEQRMLFDPIFPPVSINLCFHLWINFTYIIKYFECLCNKHWQVIIIYLKQSDLVMFYSLHKELEEFTINALSG